MKAHLLFNNYSQKAKLIFNNYPAKSRGISPDTWPTRPLAELAKSGDIPRLPFS